MSQVNKRQEKGAGIVSQQLPYIAGSYMTTIYKYEKKERRKKLDSWCG